MNELNNNQELEVINDETSKNNHFDNLAGNVNNNTDPNSKFCTHCGKKIHVDAEICPYCGCRVNGPKAKNTSSKSKVAAGILQIIPGLGIGRFYLGYTSIGIAQLLLSLFTCGIGAIWCFVDGIIILCSQDITDADGNSLS